MERLTKERLGNLKGKKFVLCNNADNSDCNDFCRYGICRWNEKAQMRLHEYEDTGLTPEEIIDGKLLTGWIPVTERLPELHRDVLVAVCDVNEDDASTFIDCLVDNNDRPTWSTYNGALDRVLAWMPLPDRYRPE